MSAISEIKIDGFKAFPNDFTLELKGKNLLLYGENGSGKSSIYYALHTLLQSQCKNKNDVYFDIAKPESIINKHTKKTDAKVEIKFEGSDTIYRISKNGYEELPTRGISPLRDLNGQCVFINHKFLFNVFSFRNSQYIDLFPVFIKDILPFVLTEDESKFISQIYDEVMQGIKRKGNSSKIEDNYAKRIKDFNEELKKLIEKINTNAIPTASEIYNKYFKDEKDPELKIILCYDENNDNIPKPNTSYFLRLGYRYQNVYVAGAEKEKKLSTSIEILQPVITLKIEEKQENETYTPIIKPQSYFNEAKLTAIALSIRFALLDMLTPVNGRFLALDDMLISLDMSNRRKVIDYLFDVAAQHYIIYIFTHDRLFYNSIKKRITIEHTQNKWISGGIYMHSIDEKNNYQSCMPYPKYIEDKDTILEIYEYYAMHDYPACGQKLRKWCERILDGLYPDTLKKRIDATTGQTIDTNLNDRILHLEEFCANEKFDYSKFKNLKIYKDCILNAVSHYDIQSPIYGNEILEIARILSELETILNSKRDIKVNHELGLELQKPNMQSLTVCIDIQSNKLKIYDYDGNQNIAYYQKCVVKKIIDNGTTVILPEPHKYVSIYHAYDQYCSDNGLPNIDNLLDILYDHGTKLRDKI